MTGWWGPISVYVFFLIGAVVSKVLMGWLSEWIYRLERKEGDFRYGHMPMRWVGLPREHRLCC